MFTYEPSQGDAESWGGCGGCGGQRASGKSIYFPINFAVKLKLLFKKSIKTFNTLKQK